jgi:hypothetical protein
MVQYDDWKGVLGRFQASINLPLAVASVKSKVGDESSCLYSYRLAEFNRGGTRLNITWLVAIVISLIDPALERGTLQGQQCVERPNEHSLEDCLGRQRATAIHRRGLGLSWFQHNVEQQLLPLMLTACRVTRD